MYLTGFLHDRKGNPVGGRRVRAKDGGAILAETQTDAQGLWTFNLGYTPGVLIQVDGPEGVQTFSGLSSIQVNYLTVDQDLDVTGDLQLDGDLDVGGQVTVGDSLSVGASAAILDDLGSLELNTVYIKDTTDAHLATVSPPLMIGPKDGLNLAQGGNRIQARDDGSAAGLGLNLDGGLVSVGSGGISVSGDTVVDPSGTNSGALSPGIRLGDPSSTEGIASKRTSGGNQGGLDFYTDDLARLSITNEGKVGVGTSAPTFPLEVSGDIGGSAGLLLGGSAIIDQSGTNDGALTPGILFGNPSSGEGIASKRTSGGNQNGLDLYTSSTPRLSVLNNGSVGVGTSAPTALLDVVDRIRLRKGSAGDAGLWLRQTAGDRAFVGMNGDNQVGFYSNPRSKWDFTLDVTSGDLLSQGNLHLRSDVTSGGAGLVQFGDANHQVWNESDQFNFKTSGGLFNFRDPSTGRVRTIDVGSMDGYLNVKNKLACDYLYVRAEDYAGGTEGGQIQLQGASGDADWNLDVFDNSTRFHSGGSTRFAIRTNGQVSVGATAEGSYGFTLPNSGADSGRGIAVGWNSYSSSKFKESVRDLSSVLSLVRGLRPVRYTDKESGSESIGLIAEEVAPLVPEAVGFDAEGKAISIDYGRLAAIALSAVKELDVRISALEQKVGPILENPKDSK